MILHEDALDKENIEQKFKDLERRLALLEKFIYVRLEIVPKKYGDDTYEANVH